MLLPPIRTIPSSHQQDIYPRRSSLPASLRDIMHTSVTPPTSTQVTENEESSSSSSGTEQEENISDSDPRVIQLANTLQSALNSQDASMPIILLPAQQQEEEEYAFTFSFQIHRHQQDTRETLASVDLDMNPGTIGHVASILNAICESLSLEV